jgi:hypothetical protein
MKPIYHALCTIEKGQKKEYKTVTGAIVYAPGITTNEDAIYRLLRKKEDGWKITAMKKIKQIGITNY